MRQNFLIVCLQKMLKWTFVAILCLFFMLYVGMEVSYGLFVATFAVESKLGLTKSDGAYITAIFWGCFAAMRFVAIFAAVKMKPIYIMLISFGCCFVGCIPLVIWGDTSPMVLKVSVCFKFERNYVLVLLILNFIHKFKCSRFVKLRTVA